MAFSLACDTDKTVLRIEGADTGVTWADVYDEGAASVAIDGGGTEDVDFFVTEYIEDVYYEILKGIQFGDDSNTLTFVSKNESVYFVDDAAMSITNNATLTIGDIDNAYGGDGAYWSIDYEGYYSGTPMFNDANAVLNIYGSQLFMRQGASSNRRLFFYAGTLNIVNAIIGSNSANSWAVLYISANCAWTMHDVYINNSKGIIIFSPPEASSGLWFHNCADGLTDTFEGTVRIDRPIFTGTGNAATVGVTGTIFELSNLEDHLTVGDFVLGTGTNPTIKELYTVDIEVLDQENVPIEGAAVKHWISASTDGGSTWGAYSYVNAYATDADGLTGDQDYYWAQWVSSAKTETLYRHRLEITASGQSKQVLNNMRLNGGTLPAQYQPIPGVFFHGSRTRISF